MARWQPVSVPDQAAGFARAVVMAAAPPGTARANALLWAAARLAAFAVPLGLEAVPQVLLHPSVIERFTAYAPGLSGPARRTLRTNLRFIARRVVPALAPPDAPHLGLATFMHAAGITCSQRLGDLIAALEPGDEAQAVALLTGSPR